MSAKRSEPFGADCRRRVHLAAVIVRAGRAAAGQPGWLKQHLTDKNMVILDVYDGNQRAVFASGHIPGARFTDFRG